MCCTVARGVIRIVAKRRFGANDSFVLLATAALVVAWVLLLRMLDSLFITEALNDHPTECSITLAEISGVLAISKWNKSVVALAWTSIFAIKGAFLCFFHILIRQLTRSLNLYFWFTVFFCTTSWLTSSFIDWAICPYVGIKDSKSNLRGTGMPVGHAI